MADDVAKLVEEAVRAGLAARSRFYASLNEPDEQALGPPATEAQIASLETALGIVLPPSYRAFLLLHDGWRMVSANLDLYSVKELLRVRDDARTAKWRKIAVDGGETFAADAVIIGGSQFAAAKLLLDPGRIRDGEMATIRHDKVDDDSYPSFLVYLQESTREFEESAGDIEGGLDFSNI